MNARGPLHAARAVANVSILSRSWPIAIDGTSGALTGWFSDAASGRSFWARGPDPTHLSTPAKSTFLTMIASCGSVAVRFMAGGRDTVEGSRRVAGIAVAHAARIVWATPPAADLGHRTAGARSISMPSTRFSGAARRWHPARQPQRLPAGPRDEVGRHSSQTTSKRLNSADTASATFHSAVGSHCSHGSKSARVAPICVTVQV